mmetsp:Transcript_12643/g.26181  ORF Transcript_12643/g.26181 Transcript_12643/m.26181 type:complete len:109 (-) Transcript_12643:128-454(-)
MAGALDATRDFMVEVLWEMKNSVPHGNLPTLIRAEKGTGRFSAKIQSLQNSEKATDGMCFWYCCVSIMPRALGIRQRGSVFMNYGNSRCCFKDSSVVATSFQTVSSVA